MKDFTRRDFILDAVLATGALSLCLAGCKDEADVVKIPDDVKAEVTALTESRTEIESAARIGAAWLGSGRSITTADLVKGVLGDEHPQSVLTVPPHSMNMCQRAI